MKELNTEILISAPAERVWEILMDFERYPQWNPFVRTISGEATEGSRLKVNIKPEGGVGMTLTPLVVDSSKNQKFGWRGKLFIGGIFDGIHEFIIHDQGETGVRFVHREEFTGLLVPILWPMLETKTRLGFEGMNVALKARAEAI